MSLKAFHILFVTLSVMLAFFFGGWLLHEYSAGGGMAQLVGAILSFLAGAGLIWYGKVVLRKLKHISYL
jgi:hypothetical protein